MGLAFRLGLRATHKEALLDDLAAGSNETVRFELDHPQVTVRGHHGKISYVPSESERIDLK